MFLENKILEFSAVRICRSSHIFLFLLHSYNSHNLQAWRPLLRVYAFSFALNYAQLQVFICRQNHLPDDNFLYFFCQQLEFITKKQDATQNGHLKILNELSPQVLRLFLIRSAVFGLHCQDTKKAPPGTYDVPGGAVKNGRDGPIRTGDPLVPNQMRYHAALHPVYEKRPAVTYALQGFFISLGRNARLELTAPWATTRCSAN